MMRRESNDGGIPKVPPEIQFFCSMCGRLRVNILGWKEGEGRVCGWGAFFTFVLCDIGSRKVTFFVLLLFFREMPRPLFLS